MVFISSIIAIYYNMITSWALFYMVNSLKFSIPWASCGNEWNTESNFFFLLNVIKIFFDCSSWNKTLTALEMCRFLNGYVLPNGTCVTTNENSTLVIPTMPTTTTSKTPMAPAVISSFNQIMPSVEYFQ